MVLEDKGLVGRTKQLIDADSANRAGSCEMAGFVLRVKTKSGQKVVNGLTLQDKAFQLKTKLAELTGVPVAALQVLVGFPPKPIELDDDMAIERIGIVSGDTLIVEEKRVRFRTRKLSRLYNLMVGTVFSRTPCV